MRRDMSLICMILAYVEGQKATGNILQPQFDSYTESQIYYHTQLCAEAGYLEVIPAGSPPITIMRITWEGHEVLDRLRK